MTKKGLIILHVPREGLAGYREPIEAADYALDRLIMMGGPMDVYEQDIHPWIPCQMRRLAQRLEAGRPTLGVCFGAQMMAVALGARVYPGPAKEVGFEPLRVTETMSPLRHVAGVPVLHWHGDTFDLPDDVELLASTNAYRHQAFRRGSNILVLQSHGEMGLDPRFDEWLRQWPEAVIETGKCAAGMREQHARFGPAAVAASRRMIAEWLVGLRD